LEVTRLASITFWSIDFFLDSINLGFFLREKLAAVLIIPSSWGSQLDGEKQSTPRRINHYLNPFNVDDSDPPAL
jgi:hypothetical protein